MEVKESREQVKIAASESPGQKIRFRVRIRAFVKIPPDKAYCDPRLRVKHGHPLTSGG